MSQKTEKKATLLEVAAQRKREHAQGHVPTQGTVRGVARRRAVVEKSWHVALSTDESTEGWLITYLDLITLLLVLLLVMLTLAGKGEGDSPDHGIGYLPAQVGLLVHPGSSVIAAGTQLPAPFSGDDKQQDLTEGLNLDNLGDDIDVILNDQSVSFRINSEILFSSGDAQLSLGGLDVLQRLAHTLKDSPHTVTIEGHTDSVPIRSVRFPSNWELSSARAGSVVRYLEANGVTSKRLRAIGYADTRPLVQNNTTAHRALNRRVELMLEMPAIPPVSGPAPTP